MQVNVDAEIREKAKSMARASGVSLALLLQTLIEAQEVDADGRPSWMPDDFAGHPELPLQSAS